MGGPLSGLYPMTPPANQDHQHSFNIGPYGKNVEKSSLKLLGQFGTKVCKNGTLDDPF